ncbi:hypothetical protein GQ42DRAFT_163461 [Ramicandelaber brevisporus]|nr:hypothetical protein GQ42DRAFT_163461 [Ramicandelaber brevisporus]
MSPAAVSSIKSTLFGSSGNAEHNEEDADAVSVVASEDSPSAGLEPFISDLERFLVERLLVPRQWLHLAYAARSIASDNPASAAIHYLLAGQYADAHSVVVTRVAPDAIIRGDHTTLFVLLQSLSPEATGGVLVPKWNVRGAVYLSYVLTMRRAQRVLDQAIPSGTADVSGSGNPPVKRARMANTPAAKHAPVDISDGVSLDADDSASLWDSIDRAADAHDQFNDRYSSSSSSHSAFERRLNSIVTDLRDVLTRLSTLDASSISAHYVRGFVKNGPETIKLRIAISTMATHAAELLRQAESHLNAGNINNAMQSAAASSISGTGSRKRTFAESTDDIHSRHSTAASASSWRHIRWSALPLAPDSRLSQVGSMSSDYIQAIST